VTLNNVPPELIGILQASTLADEDKQRIDSFFANLDPAKRPDIMKEVRSRGNWQDKIKFVLEQAKAG
jgi:hypothetical protein